jgi:hypothetical protein
MIDFGKNERERVFCIAAGDLLRVYYKSPWELTRDTCKPHPSLRAICFDKEVTGNDLIKAVSPEEVKLVAELASKKCQSSWLIMKSYFIELNQNYESLKSLGVVDKISECITTFACLLNAVLKEDLYVSHRDQTAIKEYLSNKFF